MSSYRGRSRRWGNAGRSFGQSRRRPRFYRGATYGGGYSRGVGKRFSTSRYRPASRALRTTNWNRSPDELKYLDVNSATYACGTTGAVTLINGIAAGSTAITREGRQCYWKSVHVSGSLSAADATTIASRCDVYVIWDKQPGAAVPGMTDLFVESISGSPMNLNYRERFVVLAHEMFTLGGLTAAATALTPTIHPININKRLALRSTFKGDANAIGDIGTGAMYLVTLGDQADASGGLLRASVRLRFSERLY